MFDIKFGEISSKELHETYILKKNKLLNFTINNSLWKHL